jgi:predicted hydrolase (HD superfamily)
MTALSFERAQEILHQHCQEPHLRLHALAVSSAMGAMAGHFGADREHWRAIGYVHDVDYEQYPEQHLQHTRHMLEDAGVDEADIQAVLAHGWGICSDVEPKDDLAKSLYAIDELTGIIMAAGLMRPTGIADLEVKSALKKFKDKRFAAKCDRDIIIKGCQLLGMELPQVMELVIAGMQTEMAALGLAPREE